MPLIFILFLCAIGLFISWRERTIKEKIRVIKEENNRLREQIKTTPQQIVALSNLRDNDRNEILELEKILSEKDTKIFELKSLIDDKDKKVLEANAVAHERNMELLRLKTLLQERDKEIKKFQKVLREKENITEGLSKNKPTTQETFVKVIFPKGTKNYHYLLGDLNLKVGDGVLVPIKKSIERLDKEIQRMTIEMEITGRPGEKTRKTICLPATVTYISEPGEYSSYAKSNIIKKLD